MSKRCELQKEYYQQYGNYKGSGKYSDEYVSWLENQILALRTPSVAERSEQLFCPYCGHEKSFTVSTDVNSGRICKNRLCGVIS